MQFLILRQDSKTTVQSLHSIKNLHQQFPSLRFVKDVLEIVILLDEIR